MKSMFDTFSALLMSTTLSQVQILKRKHLTSTPSPRICSIEVDSVSGSYSRELQQRIDCAGVQHTSQNDADESYAQITLGTVSERTRSWAFHRIPLVIVLFLMLLSWPDLPAISKRNVALEKFYD